MRNWKLAVLEHSILLLLGILIGSWIFSMTGCEFQATYDAKPKSVTYHAPPITDESPILAVEIGAKNTVAPTPAPDNPTPSGKVKVGDKCPNCQGLGQVDYDHDGKMDAKCVACGGDGKVDQGDPILNASDPVASISKEEFDNFRNSIQDKLKEIASALTKPKPVEKPASVEKPVVESTPLLYPEVRQPGPYWYEVGMNGQHIMPSAEHLAQSHNIPWEYASKLNQAQLNALHSDAHNGKIQWQFIPQKKPTQTILQPKKGHWAIQYLSSCRGPNCPKRWVWVTD